MFEDLHFALYKYGEHDLQRIGVWVKDPTLLASEKPAEASAPTTIAPVADLSTAMKLDAPIQEASLGSGSDDPSANPDEQAKKDSVSPSNQPEHGKEVVYDDKNATTTAQWIIFIHGGAWIDPKITYESFVPSIKHLCARNNALPIAGYASIDYRLSAHPAYPQDAGNTPKTSLREARHPDHLDDVCSAIVFLMDKFDFGSNYILVGHSCGASLSFQAVMRVLVNQERVKEELRGETQARLLQSREPEERIRKRKRSVALENGEQSGHGIHGEEGDFEDRVHDKQTAIGLVGCDWQEEQEDQEEQEEQEEQGQNDQGQQAQDKGDQVQGQGQEREGQEEQDQASDDSGEPMDVVSDDGDQDWEDADSTETQHGADGGLVSTSRPLPKKEFFDLPTSIVAISGLYDFKGYSERRSDVDTSFLAAAYGPNKADWSLAAPALFDGRFCNWHSRRATIIGSSRDDEYIDEPETASMVHRLAKEGIIYFANRCLEGKHDFVWEDGAQVADLIGEALKRASVSPWGFWPKKMKKNSKYGKKGKMSYKGNEPLVQDETGEWENVKSDVIGDESST